MCERVCLPENMAHTYKRCCLPVHAFMYLCLLHTPLSDWAANVFVRVSTSVTWKKNSSALKHENMSLFRWRHGGREARHSTSSIYCKMKQKRTEPIVVSNPTISISKAELSGCDGHKSSPLML